MKIIYLISSIFLLILTGCYSTYKVSDFSSKDKFYEDFNKSVINKTTKIKINDDSIFTSCENARITNDTLIFLSKLKNGNEKLFLSEIKNINYNNQGTNFSKLSGKIILKNGEEIFADNIEALDSSIHFKVKTYRFIPIENVKEISYENHWLGVPFGFLDGSVPGIIIGFIVNASFDSNREGPRADIYVIPSIGAIVGCVLGWIEGYTYAYQFNP
ncbi:MAG: hypothetical protein ACYC49_13505 [Ignavibacteriaceae bacterium]